MVLELWLFSDWIPWLMPCNIEELFLPHPGLICSREGREVMGGAWQLGTGAEQWLDVVAMLGVEMEDARPDAISETELVSPK